VESGISLDKKSIKPILKSLVSALEYLSRKSRLFKEFLAPILVLARKALDLVSKIDTLDPPQAAVDDVLDRKKCQCKEFVIAEGGQSVE
jgi:hypothetical protein